MSFRVNHVNKKTGVTYVYESVSYWNKEKKQSRNRQICVGKIDPATGQLVPSKRLSSAQAAARDPAITARTEIVGPSVVLDALTKQLGLDSLLKACFPRQHQQILTMAYYLASHGGSLSHCEAWSKSHAHPLGKPLASQRISEVLESITIDGKQTFLSRWMTRILENDYLCYDITSVSSYAQLNNYIRYGHNRDKEKLAQLNLAILFGQKGRLPVYYDRMPGNITDVTTVHNLLKTFTALEVKRLHYVLDKGFYSKKNVDSLLDRQDWFIVSVPLNNKWVQRVIDEIHEEMHGPEGYRMVDEEILYIHTRLYPWGKDHRRCYLHLYYNAHAKAAAVDRFSRKLVAYKEELESGKLDSSHQNSYDMFFIVKNTPKRGIQVSYNTEAVRTYTSRYAGFQALLSHGTKDPAEALQVYRDKDIVEKCFDDLKNQLDMKRLRMHSQKRIDGRLFVQFIALITLSALRKEMRKSKLIEQYSARELLQEMEPLTKIRYSGKYGHILTEVTKPQQEILKNLNIELPTKT